MRLDDKRALIIGGAGEGIGREVTRSFGSAGAKVAVTDLDAGSASASAAELEGEALALHVDVRSAEALRAMLEDAVAWLGGLDIVVTVVGGPGVCADRSGLPVRDPCTARTGH